MTPHERVLARCEPDGDCLVFVGGRDTHNNGRVSVTFDGRERTLLAHRVVYEALVGPIPEGLAVRHRCGNPPCVAIEHLEIDTCVSVMDRFWRDVRKTDTCWEWTGVKANGGYGRLWIGKQKVSAHRFAYRTLVGEIPDGLTLDHLCRNPSCVNPEHLEPVTMAENLRRAAPYRPKRRRRQP